MEPRVTQRRTRKMQVSGAGTVHPRSELTATVTATLTGNRTAEDVCLCLLFLVVFHLSLTAVKHQRSGGGGAGPQDAMEGHAQ